MRMFISQIRWQFILLSRNNLITISIILTIMYAGIFQWLKHLPNADQILILLIYNDPALIGLFFVGLSVILEKNGDLLRALFVTPLHRHSYLISRILTLTVIGSLCAVGMAVALRGVQLNWFPFVAGISSTCLIFSIAGIFVVSFTTEFLHFLLRSIPVMLLLSLPLLNYFGLIDSLLIRFTPIQASLNLIAQGLTSSDVEESNLTDYLSMLVWIPLLYFAVQKIFMDRIIRASV